MKVREFIKILLKHAKRFSLSGETKRLIYKIVDIVPSVIGNYLRWKVAKAFMKERIGKRVHIRQHAYFSFDNITIGDNVLIGEYTFFASYEGGRSQLETILL